VTFFDLPAGALTGIIAGCKADIHLIRRIVRDTRSPVKLYQAVQS